MRVPTNSIVCLLDFITLFTPLKEITKHFLIIIITAWKVLCLFHAIYYLEVKGRGEQKGNSLKVWLKFHVDAPAKKYIWLNPSTFKAMGTLKWISVELGFDPVFRRRHAGPSSSPGFFGKEWNQETAKAPAQLQAAILMEMGNSLNQLRDLHT